MHVFNVLHFICACDWDCAISHHFRSHLDCVTAKQGIKNEHTHIYLRHSFPFIVVVVSVVVIFISFASGKMHGKYPFIKIQWKYSENRCLHPFQLMPIE